ncbi:MAG: DUF4179 domain-containing protein [Ruminococcaceae bacterium]|nr:DUF4179 domain-containing protein [Oscillospiraceae bacterium]
MDNKYKELFDKITPRMSDDELLNAVLDRKAENMGNSNEKKRFGRKAILIPAVAAAVMLSTTIGVSAAYDWNIPAAIADIFGKNAEEIPDGVSFKDFNFATVGGKELTDVFKFDGGEVQMKGVAADPHSMMLFYDVVFDDAVPEEKREKLGVMHTIADLQLYVDYNRVLNAAGTADDPAFSQEWSWKHIHMATEQHTLYLGSEDNIAHYCLKHAVSGASLAGRNVTLEIEKLTKDENGDFVYGGSREEYTVDLGFVDDSNSLDIYKDNEITLSTGAKGNVSHIQLTPFSVCFRVDWGEQAVESPDENGNIAANTINVNDIYNEFKIKLKDGTVMDAKAFRPFEDGNKRSSYYTETADGGNTSYAQDPMFEWLYPVDVADVEALIVGNTTISVN